MGKKLDSSKKFQKTTRRKKFKKIPENINAINAENHNDKIDLDDNEK